MTRRKTLRNAALVAVCFAASLSWLSCKSSSSGGTGGGSSGSVKLVVAYGSEKKTWLEEQARAFEATGAKTASGKTIKIEGRAMGSGETVQAILEGELKAHVFSPASGAYVTLLNQQWLSEGNRTKPISPAGEPVVLSPIVIAMWKPMAEALGWPAKPLGWNDLLAVNANPKGWGAYGHPEWGEFKLGHTHPEFSNSGLLAILAEAYAGAKKTRGLTAADLDAKATRDFVSKVEGTIVHYGKSTGFFADKMLERGPGYVSAAVLYENLVIESYSKPGSTAPFPVVSIYPVEGTFWSDHPYAVLDAEWVGAEERDAAAAFLAHLKKKPAQERALALGFRPADPSIAIAAPVDAAHGADPKQPQTLLEVPDAPVLAKLLEMWSSSKKSTDVVFVFDKSGSMSGKPLAEAKVGAKAFLSNLGDRDEVSLLFFDSVVHPAIGPLGLKENRSTLLQTIDGTIAGGGTSLYDATAEGVRLSRAQAKEHPDRIHAVVVMTDGKDSGSTTTLPVLTGSLGGDGANSEIKVFTIAYGDDVQTDVLAAIAEAARGATAKGSTESIAQVYRDMASFF